MCINKNYNLIPYKECTFTCTRRSNCQYLNDYNHPVVERYICRDCIRRYEKMHALQNRNACNRCINCMQKSFTQNQNLKLNLFNKLEVPLYCLCCSNYRDQMICRNDNFISFCNHQ